MALTNILRRLLLAFVLGGQDVLGVGMSREQIEELLFAMHKPRIETTISDDHKESASGQLTGLKSGSARQGATERVK